MVRSRVYVGGLPWGTQERDLERFFRGYGRIMEVLLKNGYGFVEFEDARDAEDAAHELNGTKLLGERVTVERARGKPRGRDQWSTSRSHERFGPPVRTNHRLIVENLSSRVSWQDLKSYMRQAGEVTFADAHKQHREEGIVEFASYSDLKNAIRKFDDTVLSGRRIRLVEDKKSRRRRSGSNASRGRSRSRSSRHSRSRSRSRRSSRSHSRRRSRSRSRSGSDRKPRSDNRVRDKSAERSTRKSESRSKLRSRSRSRSHKSAERSRSRSRSADRHSRGKSGDRSPSRSKSRSNSRGRSRSISKRSPSRHSDKKSRSRSRTPSEGRSRSRSRSHSRD